MVLMEIKKFLREAYHGALPRETVERKYSQEYLDRCRDKSCLLEEIVGWGLASAACFSFDVRNASISEHPKNLKGFFDPSTYPRKRFKFQTCLI